MIFSWSIHANYSLIKYFGPEVQVFENGDTANEVSIDNMAWSEAFYQISVRSWQIWYQIEALNCGGSFMYGFSSFSGCHGNGSQEF